MTKHAIDNASPSRLYCLQLMTPNEAFVERVQNGEAVGRLDDEVRGLRASEVVCLCVHTTVACHSEDT